MQAAQARRQKELEEKKAKMKRLAVSWATGDRGRRTRAPTRHGDKKPRVVSILNGDVILS